MIAVCVFLTSITLFECKKEGNESEPEDTIEVVVIEGTVMAPFANFLTAMKLVDV